MPVSSNYAEYITDAAINGGDQSKNPFVSRDAYNEAQLSDVVKFQRAYCLDIGVPQVALRYKRYSDIFPDLADPRRRYYIPGTEGGPIDMKDPYADTPIDTINVGAPYELDGYKLSQGEDLGFRIQFTSEKNDKPSPNSEKIKIFNPPPEIVAVCNQDNAVARLYCGYNSSTPEKPPLLLAGSVASSSYKEEGPDKVLTILLGEMGSDYESRWTSRIYGSNTKYQEIVKSLAEYIVRNSIVIDSYSIDFSINARTNKDLNIYGDAFESLQKICRTYGFYTFVSSGVLYVKPATTLQGFEQKQVIRLTDKSGLIGKPEFVTEKKGGVVNKDKITFKCLLDPDINIRKRVLINSAAFQKDVEDPFYNFNNAVQDLTVVITGMRIKGDSFSGDWYNECTADIVQEVQDKQLSTIIEGS